MLPERGVYIVEFDLPRDRRITVGRLGRMDFPAGKYVYVGSAQRGLPQRVLRHSRRRKALRWHVDYLARHAPAVAAWAWEVGREAECDIARRLSEACSSVAGFGCSDCRCSSHLFMCSGEAAVEVASPWLGSPARVDFR